MCVRFVNDVVSFACVIKTLAMLSIKRYLPLMLLYNFFLRHQFSSTQISIINIIIPFIILFMNQNIFTFILQTQHSLILPSTSQPFTTLITTLDNDCCIVINISQLTSYRIDYYVVIVYHIASYRVKINY